MIHTVQKKHLISQPLKYWSELLPTDSFCQVHKSYVIHVDRIDKIAGGQLYINDHRIPLGRTFKEEFMIRYLKSAD